MKDHLVRILTEDKTLRAAAAATTGLVDETRRRQGTDPTATVAIGRLISGAALLGSQLKGAQRLALLIEGNGPLQRLHAEADAYGHVRASLKTPVAGLPPRGNQFDVAGAVGRAGFLHVTKDLGMKEPYRGMVQLYSSEIAEDLAYYLTTSEQIPSMVALGVCLGKEAEAKAAGGLLVQAMPGCPDERIGVLEERLRAMPPTTDLLGEGLSPLQILERLLAGIPFTVQAETDLAFRCICSQPQILRMLHSLGKEELRHLAERPEETVVTCHFCNEDYHVSRQELIALAKD
ncbi:MAG: Hsp33 family molecular chaperone HslO [Desulfuromonadales bacterium]